MKQSLYLWSLTALKSCFWTLGFGHFLFEPTVHPMSRQLMRMNTISSTEIKTKEGLSVRSFEIEPLIEMPGEDCIALAVCFSKALETAIASPEPVFLESHLAQVCQDGAWGVCFGSLNSNKNMFSGGMVHFFFTSTPCSLCRELGVNPLCGKSQAVLAVFRLTDRVLASDPFRTTIPSLISSNSLNTYESIVFENCQRVLGFVYDDTETLACLKTASLADRRQAFSALTEIIMPLQRLWPRLELGLKTISSLTQSWVAMICTFLDISSSLCMEQESILVLGNLFGSRPEGWWLIQMAIENNSQDGKASSLEELKTATCLLNEWSLANKFDNFGQTDVVKILAYITSRVGVTSEIISVVEWIASELTISSGIGYVAELVHLGHTILFGMDSHLWLSTEDKKVAVKSLRSALCAKSKDQSEVLSSALYNMDSLCYLRCLPLGEQEDIDLAAALEGIHVMDTKSWANLKKLRETTFWMDQMQSYGSQVQLLGSELIKGDSNVNLMPHSAASSDFYTSYERTEANSIVELTSDSTFFKCVCDVVNSLFAESKINESTMLSYEDEAAEQRFCYIAPDGATRCVNWFAVCVFALSNGDYEAMDSFLRSLKHQAGLVYVCPKLNRTQVSRRRHLLTLGACVQDVLGKSCPELATALVDECQCPLWSFIPTWMHQNFVGIVPMVDALYIHHKCLLHGVDYLVYFAVDIIRHVQTEIVDAAASSKQLKPSSLSTYSYCALESDDFVSALCTEHRTRVLEKMMAASLEPSES